MQVFLDTLPALVNAIILVTLGGIALYDPFVLSGTAQSIAFSFFGNY